MCKMIKQKNQTIVHTDMADEERKCKSKQC